MPSLLPRRPLDRLRPRPEEQVAFGGLSAFQKPVICSEALAESTCGSLIFVYDFGFTWWARPIIYELLGVNEKVCFGAQYRHLGFAFPVQFVSRMLDFLNLWELLQPPEKIQSFQRHLFKHQTVLDRVCAVQKPKVVLYPLSWI